MSMSDLVIGIQEDIEMGLLDFQAIAKKHKVSLKDVELCWDMLCEMQMEQDHCTNDNWYDEQYELE
jgi:hypothetical protein